MNHSTPVTSEDSLIGVIILAAGESSRMGRPKQLLEFRGKTLLRHAVDAASAICDLPVVVLGAHADAMRAELENARVTISENAEWSSGMGSSLRVGLRALLDSRPQIQSVIVMLCDQPKVTAEILRALIVTQRETKCAIVASEYGGVLGVPALFQRVMFDELLALQSAEGARKIIQRHRAETVAVPFPGGEIDVDTPADYSALRAVD